jgi:hypothetical protein
LVAAAATREALPVAFLTSALLGSLLLASVTTPLSRPPAALPAPDEGGTAARASADSSGSAVAASGAGEPGAAAPQGGLFAAADKVREAGRLAGRVVAALPGHAAAQPAAALRKVVDGALRAW